MQQTLKTLLLPHHCLLCAAKSGRTLDLCSACEADLPLLGPHCQQCALPLNDQITERCGQCLCTPPAFQRVIARWRYHSILARLISDFKYRRRLSIGELLGQLLNQHLLSFYTKQQPNLIVAMPMHWLRHLQRGFNPSEQLARQLAKSMNIPIYRGLRRHYSKTQQSLDASARRRNVKGAFKAKDRLDGLHIAVVDDVMTTGATANELSHTLKAAGAATIDIWCLARTPQPAL